MIATADGPPILGGPSAFHKMNIRTIIANLFKEYNLDPTSDNPDWSLAFEIAQYKQSIYIYPSEIVRNGSFLVYYHRQCGIHFSQRQLKTYRFNLYDRTFVFNLKQWVSGLPHDICITCSKT